MDDQLQLELKGLSVSQRIIEGYASTADEDLTGDIVEGGAAKFTSPSDVQVYTGHQHRIGALPVGIPLELRYIGDRLYTKTRIFTTTAGDDLLNVVAERLAAGQPMGISIGYPPASVIAKHEMKNGHMVRRISSLQLKEYSFTAMPANPAAYVTAVKSRATYGGYDSQEHLDAAMHSAELQWTLIETRQLARELERRR